MPAHGDVVDRQVRLDPGEDDEEQQGADRQHEYQHLQQFQGEDAGEVPPDPGVHQTPAAAYSARMAAGMVAPYVFGPVFTFAMVVVSTAWTIIRCFAVNFGWHVVMVM